MEIGSAPSLHHMELGRHYQMTSRMQSPQSRLLPDGRRLHLQHGPIDLIIEVWGSERKHAYLVAANRFQNILQELVDELPGLRSKASLNRKFDGPTARRMQAAAAPLAHFI